MAEATQHILPRGAQYIRRYGLYASRTKGKWLDKPYVVWLAPEGWKKERLDSTEPQEVRKILRHLVKIGRSPPGFNPTSLN